MKIDPNADNINQSNCDFQLVHVGDDDESIHGATNFFKKNTVNDSDQMSYESDTSKENLNHEDQHSHRSPEYQEQQDSIGSPEDHEEQQQKNWNVDEEKKKEEEEASVYSNNATHAVFENDRHSVFEDDDEMIDGAYLSNELTTLVNSWYNNFRRIPFNLRIVYILLFLVFTQLSFVEYRLYMLSRQTEINQSSESFSDDLEVCRPSVPLVPDVPSVSRNGKNKNHGQNTRHQRSNGRHTKVHHRR